MALLIETPPVVVANAFIVVVNVVFLRRMLLVPESFQVVAVPSDSPILRRFVDQRSGFAPHRHHLERMGFQPDGDRFVRDLGERG